MSVFRPGLLDRGDKARTGEALFHGIVPTISVADVAKVMVADANDALAAAAAAAAGSADGDGRAAPVGNKRPVLSLFEMKELKRAAKEGRAPKPETPGC